MAMTEADLVSAQEKMRKLRARGYAVEALYDRNGRRLVVKLHTGIELGFPTKIIQGLAGVGDEDLSDIEITPEGRGLHWPRLGAEIYVPGLLAGICGTKKWMERLGADEAA